MGHISHHLKGEDFRSGRTISPFSHMSEILRRSANFSVYKCLDLYEVHCRRLSSREQPLQAIKDFW